MSAQKSKLGFFFLGLGALGLAVAAQLVLIPEWVIPAGVSFALAAALFVLALRAQPGPEVVLGPGQTGWLLPLQAAWSAVGQGLMRLRSARVRLPRRPRPDWRMAWQALSRFAAGFVRSRFALGLTALAAALAGQLLLSQNRPAEALLLIVPALLLAVASARPPAPDADLPAAPLAPLEMPQRWPRRGLLMAGAALLLSVLAFGLFDTPVPAAIPWVLHLVSLVLFGLAFWWVDGPRQGARADAAAWSWLEIGALALVLGLGFFMRVYRLDQLPFGIYYDEAENGLEALRILQGNGYLPIFASMSSSLSAHMSYLMAAVIGLMGPSSVSLRVISVGFGLGTVAAAYFAGREMFDRRMGIVLALFLAVSRWDVNWSRIGMHGVTVPFFELLAVGFVLRGLRRHRLFDFALGGLFFGMGMSFYLPLRFFPAVVVVFFLALWLKQRSFPRQYAAALLVLALGIWTASVPIDKFSLAHPEEAFARFRTVSIFEGKTLPDGLKAVAQTTREHLLMFNVSGDRNGRHNLSGAPMLDAVSGGLLILGLGLSLRRIREPASFLMVAWLLIMLAPGIFSLDFESPQSLRAIGSLPAAYLLAAVPLHALWKEWDRLVKGRSAGIFAAGTALLLGFCAYLNYHTYFDIQAVSYDSWSSFSTPETYAGKVMAEIGSQADFYVSSFYKNVPTLRFLAPKLSDYHSVEPHETLPLRLDGTRDAVILLDNDRKPFFDQARRYYPRADFREFKSPGGQTALYEIRLKKEDIQAIQGLSASYYTGGDFSQPPFLVRNETLAGFDWKDGEPGPFPLGVEWNGILYAHNYGSYQIVIHSPGGVELWLDGSAVALNTADGQRAALELAKGNHTIRIRTTAASGHFQLDWQPPGEDVQPLGGAALLLPVVTNNGLLGSYYPNGNWQSPPAYTQIDPWIHFYYQNIPLQRPYTVEWTGNIKIVRAGTYSFGLESIDESALYLDDKAVLINDILNRYNEVQLELKAGFHPIRIRFADRTSMTHINLYWTPPGAGRDVIPQAVLYPPGAVLDMNQLAAESSALPLPLPGAPALPPSELSNLPDYPLTFLWQMGSCGSAADQFQALRGLTLDGQGNIWVADTGNQRLVQLGPDGATLKTVGGPETGWFKQPFEMLATADGGWIVLDSDDGLPFKKLDAAGAFIGPLGSSLGTYFPRGIAADYSGGFYVADTGGNRVLHLDGAGKLIDEWPLKLEEKKSGQPVSLAVSGGNLYVLDMTSAAVWEFLADGTSRNWPVAVSGSTSEGSRIAIDSLGRLFVSDPERQRILIYALDGTPLGQVRSPADIPGLLERPVGLAAGPDGLLLIGESSACRVTALKIPTR